MKTSLVIATAAVAAALITSDDIQDGSIQNRDIRSGVITMSRLAPTTQDLINAKHLGPAGPAGRCWQAGCSRQGGGTGPATQG